MATTSSQSPPHKYPSAHQTLNLVPAISSGSPLKMEGLPPPLPLAPEAETGLPISLNTDHFKVSVKNTDAMFYQYCVLITYEDNRPVEGMGIGRKLVDKLCQTISSKFAGKKFAYDGEKTLYTVGPLPRNKLEFTVVLEESFTKSETGKSGGTDKKMKRCSNRSKSFNVEISYAAKTPLKSIALALQGVEVDNTQDALRVHSSYSNNMMYTSKLMSRDGASEGETMEITVYEYFVKHCGIELPYSQHMPCIDIDKPKRPTSVPVELCALASLQRYTKVLSSQRRASLVEKSRQKAQERIRRVTDATQNFRYGDDAILAECGIFLEKQLSQMEGHILEIRKLKVGNNEDCIPFKGRWNSNNNPLSLTAGLMSTSEHSVIPVKSLGRLSTVGRKRLIEGPFAVLEEEPQSRRQSPVIRVEKMFEQIKRPWKKKCLSDFGIVTQCISPAKINDQYITNMLLKINSKLGGINSSLLSIFWSIQSVGPPSWPLISRYRAAIRTQSPEVEMIDTLNKPLENGKDDGIIRCINPNIKPEVQKDIVSSMHGTTIILVHNLSMLVVGVDSMATVKYIANDPNNRTYELATSTKEDKFPEISPVVYATLCGDGKRCQEMVEYVHMELQDVIYMGLTPAFTSVLHTVFHFFRIVSPWGGDPEVDKVCTVHICQWDYRVFAVGDLFDEPKEETEWVFGCGSGSRCALHDLRHCVPGAAVLTDRIYWLSFVKNDTVLIYLVVLLSQEGSRIWFHSYAAFRGAIRRKRYKNSDRQCCDYYVGYASLELLSRAVNMNSFQDLARPIE
ncbi:hypothetical protein OROMI_011212 [Orobanche minor]